MTKGNLGPAIGRRSADAGAWVATSHIVSQGLRLGANLVLARLLLPEAFGLMALIGVILLALGLLSDIGSGTVIVQSARGSEARFIQTAWTMQVVRGTILAAAGVFLALGLHWLQQSKFLDTNTTYGNTQFPELLAVASIGLLIQGFASLNGKLAERNLKLKRVVILELTVQVATLALMMIAAHHYRSPWALVAGGLFSSSVQTAASHFVYAGPKAKFCFDKEVVRELFGKGKWILVSSLLGFVATNGDRFILGALVDSTTLGLYSIALGLAGIVTSAISALLSRVIYPAFSQVAREQPAQLAAIYRRFQVVVDFLLGTSAGLTLALSDTIVRSLYDLRYKGAAEMLVYMAAASIGARQLVVEQIYVAIGRTSLLAAAIFPRALVILCLMPILYFYFGISGALLAMLLSNYAHWPQAILFAIQLKLYSIWVDAALCLWILIGFILGAVVENFMLAAG